MSQYLCLLRLESDSVGGRCARYRSDYLDDDGFRALQHSMTKNPDAGDVIEGTGGLRKLRFGDSRRGKGRRGGLRVIYYWWDGGSQFWLFTLHDQDEMSDLNVKEKKAFKIARFKRRPCLPHLFLPISPPSHPKTSP